MERQLSVVGIRACSSCWKTTWAFCFPTGPRLNITTESDCRRLHCSLRDLSSLCRPPAACLSTSLGTCSPRSFSDALTVVEVGGQFQHAAQLACLYAVLWWLEQLCPVQVTQGSAIPQGVWALLPFSELHSGPGKNGVDIVSCGFIVRFIWGKAWAWGLVCSTW